MPTDVRSLVAASIPVVDLRQVEYYSSPDAVVCVTPPMPATGGAPNDPSLFPLTMVVAPASGATYQAQCGTYCL